MRPLPLHDALPPRPRPAAIARALACALCAMVFSAAALAQSATPVDSLSKALKLKPDEPTPKDFVRQSRPPAETLRYVPINTPRADPPKSVMSPDEVRKMEADLDRVRTRHDAISGRKPLAGPFRSTANDAKPRTPPVVGAGCAITCVVNSDVATSVTNTVAPPATQPEIAH
jgi:hypothetical protein